MVQSVSLMGLFVCLFACLLAFWLTTHAFIMFATALARPLMPFFSLNRVAMSFWRASIICARTTAGAVIPPPPPPLPTADRSMVSMPEADGVDMFTSRTCGEGIDDVGPGVMPVIAAEGVATLNGGGESMLTSPPGPGVIAVLAAESGFELVLGLVLLFMLRRVLLL